MKPYRSSHYDREQDESSAIRKVVLFSYPRADTELAYAFVRSPGDENEENIIWLPKSRIKSILREVPNEAGFRRCTVETEEWLLEKNEL